MCLPARRGRQLDIDIVRIRHARACRSKRCFVSAEWPTAMLCFVLPCDKHLDDVLTGDKPDLNEKKGRETDDCS